MSVFVFLLVALPESLEVTSSFLGFRLADVTIHDDLLALLCAFFVYRALTLGSRAIAAREGRLALEGVAFSEDQGKALWLEFPEVYRRPDQALLDRYRGYRLLTRAQEAVIFLLFIGVLGVAVISSGSHSWRALSTGFSLTEPASVLQLGTAVFLSWTALGAAKYLWVGLVWLVRPPLIVGAGVIRAAVVLLAFRRGRQVNRRVRARNTLGMVPDTLGCLALAAFARPRGDPSRVALLKHDPRTDAGLDVWLHNARIAPQFSQLVGSDAGMRPEAEGMMRVILAEAGVRDDALISEALGWYPPQKTYDKPT